MDQLWNLDSSCKLRSIGALVCRMVDGWMKGEMDGKMDGRMTRRMDGCGMSE